MSRVDLRDQLYVDSTAISITLEGNSSKKQNSYIPQHSQLLANPVQLRNISPLKKRKELKELVQRKVKKSVTVEKKCMKVTKT
ncbi:hypothetical protein O3P69_003452 [Scylla paramamosain]|uniref:Uncharacterized protein n=1 Tax=Scylla paramamosain TaxID=85552 RepID=A0AAW0UJH2_SCYPA